MLKSFSILVEASGLRKTKVFQSETLIGRPPAENFQKKKVGGRSPVEISREVGRHPPAEIFQKENEVPTDKNFLESRRTVTSEKFCKRQAGDHRRNFFMK